MPTQLVDILCVFYVIQKIVSISIMFCILLDVICQPRGVTLNLIKKIAAFFDFTQRLERFP